MGGLAASAIFPYSDTAWGNEALYSAYEGPSQVLQSKQLLYGMTYRGKSQVYYIKRPYQGI